MENRVGMWSQYVSNMMNIASAPLTANPPQAFREARSTMLETWAEAWDRFLRSPPFLEVQQLLSTNIKARQQMSDFLGQCQHQFEAVSRQDVDQLMRALKHLEQCAADEVERLGTTLDHISQRLAAVEAALDIQGSGGQRSPQPSENGSAAARRTHRRRPTH